MGTGPNLSYTTVTFSLSDLEEEHMKIDCDECSMQHTNVCRDCVVGHLLQDLLGPIEVDREHAAALEALADAGLVPQLRLLPRAVGD